jgi:hypothetical protein
LVELTTAFTDYGYGQPDPVERAEGRRLTKPQWVLASAVWLLALWSPGPAPGWSVDLISGRAKARRDQQWPAPPSLPEIAGWADFPTVTGAAVLTSRVSPGPGHPYEPARSDGEVAAELVHLISAMVPASAGRAQSLIRFLSGELAGPYSDLLQLTAAHDEPHSLHLLHRDSGGSTLRLSLRPAKPGDAAGAPPITSDGPDALLRTRISCVMTLLSDMLWLNNSSPVTFRFRIGQPGPAQDDGHDGGDGDPMAAAARWWARTREEGGEDGEEQEFSPLTADGLRSAIQNTVRMHLSELYTGDWDGIEEFPEVPAGHLSEYLGAELAGLILTRLGENAQIAYSGFLPQTWPPEGELSDAEICTILFTSGKEAAVLEIDLMC